MQLSWTRMPFKYSTQADYVTKLNEYISEVFYNRLPAVGYDVREEQVYTAYRIAQGLAQGKVMMAEAGLGTGKTLAYLVSSICHARLRGQPVVIASAGSVLQEQILKPEGDLLTLSQAMQLNVDARLAKNPHHYLCEIKVEHLRRRDLRKGSIAKLLAWSAETATGDRTEVPDIPDETWKLAAWDPSLPCETCPKRGFCHLTRSREQYRPATDLVVCDHNLFFLDLWTRRERREAGQLPLLPAYSAVVFDEGHEILDAGQRTAGVNLRQDLMKRVLVDSYANSDRKGLLTAIKVANVAQQAFWEAADAAIVPGDMERLHVNRTKELTETTPPLVNAILTLQDELAIEEAMWRDSDEEVRLLALQAGLDNMLTGLSMLRKDPGETILYAEDDPRGYHLWAVPRRVDQMLKAELFSQKVPVILSSATLAAGNDFTYLKRLIGAPDALSTQVGTPFNLEEQARVYIPRTAVDPVAHLLEVLTATNGRALVLVNTQRELRRLKKALAEQELPWPLIWEEEGERAELVRRFTENVRSVLIGTSFWEGIDVPGESLSCVVVLKLPFAPHDPVLIARRDDAKAAGDDPFAAVDVPAMAVKLKQGRGRLIRSVADRGVFALLDTDWLGSDYEDDVRGAFPEDAPEIDSLAEVADFLGVTVS